MNWDELINQSKNEQTEEALRQSAIFMKQAFDIYRSVGFNDEQALQLIKVILQQGIANAKP